jgi:hypothetical protein
MPRRAERCVGAFLFMADKTSLLTEPNPIKVGYDDINGDESEYALKVAVTGSVTVGAAGGTITPGAVSVGVAATLIRAAAATRKALLIENNSIVDVFLGPAGVTIVNGMKLIPGAVLEDTSSTAAWYGIVAVGTADVRFTEVTP